MLNKNEFLLQKRKYFTNSVLDYFCTIKYFIIFLCSKLVLISILIKLYNFFSNINSILYINRKFLELLIMLYLDKVNNKFEYINIHY
jgi:hypothetical protein